MIKYKNNINVGTGSVGYEADATSAAPADTVSGGKIVKSEGRTVKWNQLVQNGNFANTSKWNREGSTVFTVYDNIAHITKDSGNHGLAQSLESISGHKYFMSFTGYCESDTTISLTFSVASNVFLTGAISAGKWGHYSDIKTCSTGKTACYLYEAGQTPHEILVKNVQAFDLTDIFGAGNEPATVEAFEEWLSENMVEQDYYAYDAGSLVPVMVKGVKRDVGGTTVTNPMPVTTLKDENDVVMFPDGLKSAGSVKDEIDWEHGVAVKRVGVVDLGDLNWTLLSGYEHVFRADNSLGKPHNNLEVANAISTYYIVVNAFNVASTDKSINVGGNTNSSVTVNNSLYADAATFTTAMSGVLLYYELATPITYHFATHAELKKRMVKIGESVEVDGIEGETVVWNQLAKALSAENWQVYNTNKSSVVFSNGVARLTNLVDVADIYNNRVLTIDFQGNRQRHKFLYAVTVTPSYTGNVSLWLYGKTIDDVTSGQSLYKLFSVVANNKERLSTIIDANERPDSVSVRFAISSCINGGALPANSYLDIEDYIVFDLTQMFGSGNEPTTVEAFESWLSAHGGIEDYYPYCAGELKDKEEGNVRGVGFNLWDEEWESGYLDSSGAKKVDATSLRSKNFTSVIAGQSYYFKVPQGAVRICWYTSAKEFISKSSAISNNTQTAPNNAAYLMFYTTTAYGTTYNHDICINLSDASRNGTYVPYKSITRSVDLTTLKGKVDGAGEDVVMFPDGMKQAGSVKDEIFVEGGVVKAVKRVGTVDLGELTWEYGPNYATPIFLSGRATIGAAANNANQLCAIYKTSYGFWQFSGNDMCVAIGGYYLNISNSAYTSASDFKTAMQGVMLNYELASPVTYVVNMQGMEMAEVKKVMVGTNLIYEK